MDEPISTSGRLLSRDDAWIFYPLLSLFPSLGGCVYADSFSSTLRKTHVPLRAWLKRFCAESEWRPNRGTTSFMLNV